MFTRRQFSKLGFGLAALSQTARQVFAPPDGGYADPISGHIPREGADIRRVGIRPNGEYWGLNNEKIDMLSGNLNYSLPLLRAGGRRAAANIICSYNSQIWKKDEQKTYLYGADLGCGFGWKVQLGAVVPRISQGNIIGYTVIGSSGAEYPLVPSPTVSNIWICLQGMFISYDPEHACLRFPNGDFWIMGCKSASGERDSCLYPTLIEDSNGNQIIIDYMQGRGSTEPNSSSRILAIRDARAADTTAGRRTFSFIYSEDECPHLAGIVSHIVGGQNYVFAYDAQRLSSPFASADLGSVSMLTGIQSATAMKQSFAYSEYGELSKAQLPYGGCLRWYYDTINFSKGRKIREVVRRSIASSPEASESAYEIIRNDNNRNAHIHGNATLCEPGHSAEKVWSFCDDMQSPNLGLTLSLEERGEGGLIALRRTDCAWSRTAAGVPYKGCVTTTFDPGSADEASRKIEYIRDLFGNMVEVRRYDFGANTPFSTVYHKYLTEPAYLTRHIFNRRVSISVNDGVETTELFKHKFDTTPLVDRVGVLEHDVENCGMSYTVRGNLTEIWRDNKVFKRFCYDITGFLTCTEDSAGNRIEFVPAEGSNNVGIAQVIPDGNLQLSLKTQYDPDANPEELSPINKSLSVGEVDRLGRLHAVISPKGERTSLDYDASNKVITISGAMEGYKITLDSFRRVASIQHDKSDGPSYLVEYGYDSETSAGSSGCCGQGSGKPIFFKPKRASLPHAPGTALKWIEYDYDSLGRLVSHKSPAHGGSKKYVYKGNSTLILGADGVWKKLVRNAKGQLQRVVTPNPQSGPDLETIYRYNRKGRLIGVTMPRLGGIQKREFLPNREKRETTINHAESGLERRMFNADGTLASRTDAKGQRTVYNYDNKKRRNLVERFDASGQLLPSQCIRYFYDTNPFDPAFSENAEKRLAAVQWGSPETPPGLMTEMYNYSEKGKLVAKRFRINRGGNDIDLDLRYSYDDKGRLSTVTYPTGGPILKYEYNSSGRPNLMKSGSEVLVSDVLYDSMTGRLVSYKQFVPEAGDYLEQRQIFDSTCQLNRIEAKFEQDSAPLVNIEYEYDKSNRVAEEKDHVSNDVASFRYDSSGRLKRAKSAGNVNWEAEYEYDGFGNRVNQKKKHGAAPEFGAKHDSATNRVDADRIRYDENGNIITLFDMNLGFDIKNRLVKIDRQGQGAEHYAYSPANLRVWKKLPTGEEEIHFYGSGGRRLATYRLTVDEEGNGDVSLIDHDMYFAGRLLRSHDKPVVLDRLGSVHAWIDANKNITRGKYYPFGEEREVTRHNRRKFGTYVRDEFSKLDYAEQRYYSSALGRFITPDPYEGSIRLGNPDSWNRYAYCENDPINSIDPHGTSSCPIPYTDCGLIACPNYYNRFTSLIYNCSAVAASGFYNIGGPHLGEPYTFPVQNSFGILNQVAISDAFSSAQQILSNNQACYDLIAGGAWDPFSMLRNIWFVADNNISNNQIMIALSEPTPPHNGPMRILINPNTNLWANQILPSGPGNYFDNFPPSDAVALMILHELGHATDVLVNDDYHVYLQALGEGQAQAYAATLSGNNSIAIANACFNYFGVP
jgi:RHS repeat-associated protein